MNSKRYEVVDGLRGLSILWVMSFHVLFVTGFVVSRETWEQLVLTPVFWRPFLQGDMGVDVFFVLSGFLIGGQLMAEWDRNTTIDLKRFYLRRAWRLLPAYYAAMIFCALIPSEHVRSIWSNLLYVNNYIPIDSQFMGWTWSLAVEEQFYLICPLLLLTILPRRFPLGILGGFFLSSFLILGWLTYRTGLQLPLPFHPILDAPHFQHYFDSINVRTQARFGPIVVGVIAAYLHRTYDLSQFFDRHRHWAKGILWFTSALFGFALFFPLTGMKNSTWGLAYFVVHRNLLACFVGYLILYLSSTSARDSMARRVLSMKILKSVADISYSAYLIHMPLMLVWMAMLAYFIPLNLTILVACFFVMPLFALGAAKILHKMVERPALKYRDRLLKTDAATSITQADVS